MYEKMLGDEIDPEAMVTCLAHYGSVPLLQIFGISIYGRAYRYCFASLESGI